jgi:hypothetical protein
METHSQRGQVMTELLVIVAFLLGFFVFTQQLGLTATQSQNKSRFQKFGSS